MHYNRIVRQTDHIGLRQAGSSRCLNTAVLRQLRPVTPQKIPIQSPPREKYICYHVIGHIEAEPNTMDETLPERFVASPAHRVLVQGRTDEMQAHLSGQNENETNRAEVEIRPTPELFTDPVRSVNQMEPVPAISQQARHAAAHTVSVEHSEAIRTDQLVMADVLHVGCGVYEAEKLPLMFRHAGWREIRLDIDPEVNPDVVASITDMHVISDAAVDAVYSSHNVEHLYPHEVPIALREMHRVLKPNGFAFIKLPDLQEVARHVAEGKLEDPLYISPMGAIAALDILYGHRPSLARGNVFMAHHTGFTGATLGAALIAAGFAAVMVQRILLTYSLTAIAFEKQPDTEQMATWRARMLPAADRPTVLYTLNG
jgi:SAM-dependent methyltransferase